MHTMTIQIHYPLVFHIVVIGYSTALYTNLKLGGGGGRCSTILYPLKSACVVPLLLLLQYLHLSVFSLKSEIQEVLMGCLGCSIWSVEESKEGGIHGIFCEDMYYLKSAKSAVLFCCLSSHPLFLLP